jgi:hypothetical protein
LSPFKDEITVIVNIINCDDLTMNEKDNYDGKQCKKVRKRRFKKHGGSKSNKVGHDGLGFQKVAIFVRPHE